MLPHALENALISALGSVDEHQAVFFTRDDLWKNALHVAAKGMYAPLQAQLAPKLFRPLQPLFVKVYRVHFRPAGERHERRRATHRRPYLQNAARFETGAAFFEDARAALTADGDKVRRRPLSRSFQDLIFLHTSMTMGSIMGFCLRAASK